MDTYQTTADKCRAALKAAGYNARRVTVRADGESIYVTVRDASVRIGAVEAIARTFHQVSRDVATDEILLGGNTYVRVKYLPAIVSPIADVIEAQLRAVEPFTVVRLASGRRLAFGDERIPHVTVDGSLYCHGIRTAAERLAVEQLDAGGESWLDRLDLDGEAVAA